MSSGMSLRMVVAELVEQTEKLRSVLEVTDENEPSDQAVVREEPELATGAERDLCTYIETVEACLRRMQKLTHAVALLIARIEE